MAATRHLAAILAADVAGYSRLMGGDEEGTLERLKAHRRELIDPRIAEHHGRIVKTTGDGLLVEFPSVVDALKCAVEIQRAMLDRSAGTPEDKRIAFRIGVNLGDVIIDGDDIYGDGVNVAARLEAMAEAGGICISRVVRDQIRDKLPYAFQDLGEQNVKNIPRPVRAFVLGTAAVAALPPVAAPPRPSSTRQRVRPRRDAPRLSIVVLPFANLSDDREQEYFADGITDDLTADLSRISGSFVIARNTAFTYKGKSIDVKQVGHDLGVRYVLEGSVRRNGDHVRVNVQLIDAETSGHVWADRFETDRANLVEAQDAITARLARSLNVELVRDASRRIDREKAVDPDARDLVMRGWAAWYQPRSEANTREAQRAFEQALALEPRSTDAKIGLATVLAVTVANGMSSSVAQDKARAGQLLLEALDRDPDRAMARYAMAVLRQTQNRLAEARIEVEKAIALDPNFALAHHSLGQTLLFMGQPDAAIPHAETALRLSPHDPVVSTFYWGLGACHLVLGQLDEAIDFLRQARAANPQLLAHHLWLAAALGLKGDLDEAKAALAESLKLNPGIDSVAHWRAQRPSYNNPAFWALLEQTGVVGLRRAGLPDE